jgi:hypothetical protein
MPMVTVSRFQANLGPNTALDSVSLVRSMRYKTRTSGHASRIVLARLRGSAIRHAGSKHGRNESSAAVFLDRKLVTRQDRGAASSGRLHPAGELRWNADCIHRVFDQQDEVKQISHLSSAMRYAKIEGVSSSSPSSPRKCLQGELGCVRSTLVSKWLKMTSIRKSFRPPHQPSLILLARQPSRGVYHSDTRRLEW